ncbi:MAG: TonB-dependent receptor domain-containing protein, partial [Steroidobacteraceae bacterium]
SSANPTFGVRYKPLSDVMLRASYGTGFLPASVHQIVPAPAPTLLPAFIFPILGLTDPRRGDEFVGASLAPGQNVVALSGGNPDLDPEESESWSAGLVLTPRFVPGLRVSADWTRTEKTGNIGFVIPTLQANLDLEQLIPGLVTRDTNPATFGTFGVGPIIGLDARLRNVAFTQVEAYDFAVDYRWASERFGEFMLSSAATHYVHNETRAVPLAPLVENTGTITGLPWRGHATLSWDYKNWTASWTARYFDSYQLFAADQENAAVIQTQGAPRVPSQTYHDLFASFRFDSQAEWLSGTEIQIGVNNVFNTRPPVDVTQSLLYSTLGDPRLASYYVSLRKAF